MSLGGLSQPTVLSKWTTFNRNYYLLRRIVNNNEPTIESGDIKLLRNNTLAYMNVHNNMG